MGTDGRAYVTPEEMEDQNLRIKDMRLHMRIHLAGVSAMMRNKAKVHKDTEERASQACSKTKRVDTTKTADSEELGDPHEKLKDLKWKVSHHVHNGTKWVGQQVEHHPLIGNLHVDVDRSGYESLGFPEPSNTHPQVVCRLANTGS